MAKVLVLYYSAWGHMEQMAYAAAEGAKEGGAKVEVKRGRRTVVDGPFAESKELVGGFYVIEVGSIDEAIGWAMRCPTGLGFDDVLEIRQLTGEEDLPPQLLELIKRAAPTWSATFSRGGRT